jgi:DNA-binding XRE family transcriptional regulator
MTTENGSSFAGRVRQARIRAGYDTQSDLAADVGVSPQSVQQWESTNPKYQTQPRGKPPHAGAASFCKNLQVKG